MILGVGFFIFLVPQVREQKPLALVSFAYHLISKDKFLEMPK